MRTLALILMEAGPLAPGFHLHIDNPPWMPLDIEDIETSGPSGLATVSVRTTASRMAMPCATRRCSLRCAGIGAKLCSPRTTGAMTISASSSIQATATTRKKLFTLSGLKQQHEAFARTWDRNLRSQGFYEAFMRSRSQ